LRVQQHPQRADVHELQIAQIEDQQLGGRPLRPFDRLL